jgi:putative transposase
VARPLRVEYQGACYHVMNRGNRGMSIFAHNEDNHLFLNKLREYAKIFSVSIRAYCLMGNHFHLYGCTPEANLSQFRQSFLTSFTLSKNRRDGERGHLFQGRFKAILVEDRVSSAQVSR